MQIANCFILAGIGILTVFAVLFVLSILIRFISFTVRATTPDGTHAKVPFTKHGVLQASPNAQTSCGNCKQYDVDDDTAAMVMAIVAETMDVPLSEITFISIREVNQRKEPRK